MKYKYVSFPDQYSESKVSVLLYTGGQVEHLVNTTLQWRHNGRDSVANQQHHDCLLNRLFRRRSKKTSKLRITGLCAGNSPGKWPVTRKMFPFDDVIRITDGHRFPQKLTWRHCNGERRLCHLLLRRCISLISRLNFDIYVAGNSVLTHQIWLKYRVTSFHVFTARTR